MSAHYTHHDEFADLLDDNQHDLRTLTMGRQRLIAVVIALVAVLVTGLFVGQAAFTSGQAGSPAVAVQSRAVAATIIAADGTIRRQGLAQPVAGASNRRTNSVAAHSAGTDGVVGAAQRLSTEATLSLGSRRSASKAVVGDLSLFGGRIKLQSATLNATASIANRRAQGGFTLGSASQLIVDGKPEQLTPNRKIVLAGIGTVILNEQAVVSQAPAGDAQSGPRYRVVGALAHVRLTSNHGGLAAGSEVIIGQVDAGVRQGKVTSTKPASHVVENTPPPVTSVQTGSPRPGSSGLPRSIATSRANASQPLGNLQGYTFPVLGSSSYVDTWGAARASTGVPHQGTDIFANTGTPIVAPADGVLDRVGWNTIGGYRFWLFDQYGNSFYFAHLSAYSPLAQDGALVRAGDVIGFVGDTGDAKGTPPHLHFEIQPGNVAPVNPFGVLNAWQKGVAVAIGLTSEEGEPKRAPLTLLQFSDISANSGLQPSILDTVPRTFERPIEDEHSPVDNRESLTSAISGDGITGSASDR